MSISDDGSIADALADTKRLKALRDADLLDSLPEETFDRLARLAARLLDAPLAQVNLIDDRRQFSKSSIAPPEWTAGRETPLEDSFCKFTIVARGPLVVEDARAHPLVADSAAVKSHGLIAYAGMPLITPEGYAFGTLCVGDFEARKWAESDLETLSDLASSVTTEIQLRRENRRFMRSEATLRAVLEASPDVVELLDTDFRFRWLNPAAREVLGFGSEQLEGLSMLELLHPEDREYVAVSLTALAECRTDEIQLRYRARCRNGEWRVLDVRGRRSENGEVEGIVLVARDVSVQARLEEGLKRSERHHRELFHSNPFPMWAYDPESLRILEVNETAVQRYGYTRDEFLSMNLRDLRPPEMLSELLQANARPREKGRFTSQGLHRHRTRDGSLLDVEVFTQDVLQDGQTIRVALMHDVTESRKAEIALQESNELLTSIIEGTSDPIFIKDLQSRYVLVNSATARNLGCPVEDILGRDDSAFFPADAAREFMEVDQRVISRGEMLSFDEIVPTPDGGRDYSITKLPRRDHERRIVGVIGIARDITERKKAERALQERARHARFNAEVGFALTADSTSLPEMLQRCTDSMVTHLDAAFARIWTLDEAEQVLELQASAGMYTHLDGPHARVPVGQFKIGRIAAQRVPYLSNHVQDDAQISDREWAKREGMVAFAGFPLVIREKVIGVIAMFARQPLSEAVLEMLQPAALSVASAVERMRAEEQLRRREHQLALAQQIAGVGSWEWDIELDQITWSDEMYRIFALAREDFTGTIGAVLELIHPDDRERVRNMVEKTLRTGAPFDCEPATLTRSGEIRHHHARGEIVVDGSGTPIAMVGTAQDITERVRTAAALRAVKEEAQAANSSKTEFLSRMSHELRTPLNAILGFAQILELDVEGEENRESVEQVLKAGRHLLALIDEVLDISKIEAGAMSLSVEPVSLRDALAESLDLVQHLGRQHGIALRAERALASAQFVAADRQRLKQVLLNLLSNAVKYNRKGGTVTVTCDPAGEDSLRIAVRDTGFGIPADLLQRLFKPFDRLGKEHSAVDGNGLGLALSRGLVEAMGGRMGVESVEAEGSTFWVELPTIASPEDAAPMVPDEGRVHVETTAAESTHTVLFVEDNLANVRLMERLFKRRPHVRLLTAMQGSMGLELAREHRPDLILLDVNLPGVSGDEVLIQLRRDPELRGIPVVMISGDAIPAQIQRVLELGAEMYMTKPFDIQELLRVVDEQLQRHER